MGPDGLYLRVHRELANVLARLHSIVFEKSWRLGEICKNWRKGNVTSMFKKVQTDHAGKCRPVSLLEAWENH